MKNKDIIFPYYSGDIQRSCNLGHVSLYYFINAHKNPREETNKIFNAIQKADEADDKLLKRQLKHQLFSFTPSVFIAKGERRKYENVLFWTGLMQLDFDKLEDEETAVDLKNHLFKNYRHIVTCYLSPSRRGVKAIMKVDVPSGKDHFKAMHKAIAIEMEKYDCFDGATTNAMLPLFLSRDKDILYREFDECWTWNQTDWTEPTYVQLNDAPSEPHNFNPENVSEDEYLKTIRIYVNKIEGIFSDGHTQLRSASLILGSRVGAGYISDQEARQLGESLINNNTYLQKDLGNYIRTMNWSITQGTKNPKYYN